MKKNAFSQENMLSQNDSMQQLLNSKKAESCDFVDAIIMA